MFEHREEIKKREENAMMHAAERDLYNRSKVLFEMTEDSQIRIWSEQYRGGNITLEEWRSRITAAEKEVENKKAAEPSASESVEEPK
jgi:hypothetical protein